MSPRLRTRPSLLKIDVQGFELEVLKGTPPCRLKSTPSMSKPPLSSFAKGRPCIEEIERHLQAADFRLDGCFNEHIHQGERIQADWFFRQV